MWRWSNVPVPPQYVIGVLAGLVLQAIESSRWFSRPAVFRFFAVPLILGGVGLAAWAVWEAGSTTMEESPRLIATGPYQFSRNPMYLAWAFIYAGIGLLGPFIWMLAALPLLLAYTHFVDVIKEERQLEARFGEKYRTYKETVPRYI